MIYKKAYYHDCHEVFSEDAMPVLCVTWTDRRHQNAAGCTNIQPTTVYLLAGMNHYLLKSVNSGRSRIQLKTLGGFGSCDDSENISSNMELASKGPV